MKIVIRIVNLQLRVALSPLEAGWNSPDGLYTPGDLRSHLRLEF